MLGFHLSYKWLYWRRPAADSPLPSLPDGIKRHFIQTPGGRIEVLYAEPKTPNDANPSPSPLFFVHGGMGGAWVWLEYLSFFAAKGIPCYAVSMRGHGNSWCPSFLRMCYGTTKRMLADDIIAGVRWAMEREGGQEVVLVGHSSGGGLSQYIVAEGDVKVKGLVLAGAVPGFGSFSVYKNWFLMDPLFSIRMLLHGWHPNSPLSHPSLTRAVFFAPPTPTSQNHHLTDSYLANFQRRMSRFESFIWVFGMSYDFANPRKLMSHISHFSSLSESSGGRDGLMVLAGEHDAIVTVSICQRLAERYRGAYRDLVDSKKLDRLAAEESVRHATLRRMEGSKTDTVGCGVRLCVVPGAGHHLQNDVTWEVGAQKLLEFYEQL